MFFLTKKNNIFKNALSIKKMVFADDLFKESKKKDEKSGKIVIVLNLKKSYRIIILILEIK